MRPKGPDLSRLRSVSSISELSSAYTQNDEEDLTELPSLPRRDAALLLRRTLLRSDADEGRAKIHCRHELLLQPQNCEIRFIVFSI